MWGRRLFTSVIEPVTLAEELGTADVAVGALKPVNGGYAGCRQ